MSITISQAQTSSDMRAFYNFARRVYLNDPNWVPHLWPHRKAYYDHTAAFFGYGEGALWLARRGGAVVGTIGTAIDHARNAAKGLKAGFFGFFEVLPHGYDTARALWDHAGEWARARGMEELRGPYNFTVNEDPGFLIEGHDTVPAVLMGHTPPYYAAFAERYGFRKLVDGLAWRLDLTDGGGAPLSLPPSLERVAGRAYRRYGPDVVRSLRLNEWDRELDRLHTIYNEALGFLPEFGPVEREEFEFQARSLKAIMDPDLVAVAQVEGESVGFAVGIPNITEALKYAKGLRYPWDYIRLWLARRHVTGFSLKILALKPAYWKRGLGMAMIARVTQNAMAKGYSWVDCSLTSEANFSVNRLAAKLGASVYRRYREYRLSL